MDMPCDWSKYLLSKSSGIHGQQISEYVLEQFFIFLKSLITLFLIPKKRNGKDIG